MRTFAFALTFIALSGCAVIDRVPASNCGYVRDAQGLRHWTCEVITRQPPVYHHEE